MCEIKDVFWESGITIIECHTAFLELLVYEVGVPIVTVDTVSIFSNPKWALSLKWKDAISRKLMLSKRDISSFLGFILLWEIEVVSTSASLFSRLIFHGLVPFQSAGRGGSSEPHFILHLHLVLDPVSKLVQLGRLVFTILLLFLLSSTLGLASFLFGLLSLQCYLLLLFLDVVPLLLQGLLENHHILHLSVLLVLFFLFFLLFLLSSLLSLFMQDFAFIYNRLSFCILLRRTFLPLMLHLFDVYDVGNFWIAEVKKISIDHACG